ncbi:MAG: hypothetical protein ACP5OX_01985 [Minisyncoccia bacterium]
MFLYYFLQRIIALSLNFINTYYIGGFQFFFNLYENLVYKVEKKLGFFIHLKYLTIPLWSIYSFAGYLVSIPIRIIKIVFSGIILVFISVLFCLGYFIWAVLPVYLILKTISP